GNRSEPADGRGFTRWRPQAAAQADRPPAERLQCPRRLGISVISENGALLRWRWRHRGEGRAQLLRELAAKNARSRKRRLVSRVKNILRSRAGFESSSDDEIIVQSFAPGHPAF